MASDSKRSSRRYDLGQALERWPDEVFAPLGGSVLHVIAERLATPRTYCTAVCGASGFAPGMEFEALTDEPVCMRCTGKLT